MSRDGQGITSVNSSLTEAITSIRGKTASARADSVGKITTYEAKYRPHADKYNTWCVWSTAATSGETCK